MQDSLDTSKNVQLFRYYVQHYGLVYRATQRDSLRLPAYEGTLNLLHAKSLA
jgi:hypothetical protein